MPPRFLAAALFALAASAQTSDRVFFTPHVQSTADLQSIVSIVRSVGDIQQVTAEFTRKAITVKGDAAQFAFVDWATHELDDPTGGAGPREYRIGEGDRSIVRIYYLTNIKTPLEIQEVLNAIRSVADVQRMLPYNTAAALVARGTADEMAAVDWLVHELDQPAPAKTSADLPMPWTPRVPEVAKVFALKTATPVQLQEIANLTRSVADIQRFFPISSSRVIVARGTAEQIAIAGWIIQQLENPTPAPPPEYRTTDKLNPVIRIAFLPETVTVQSLLETVNVVRAATRLARVFPITHPKVIAIRGTADQVSRADLLLNELTAPK